MKKKIFLVCLTTLFSLCGCESPTPTPVSESSIADISSSSIVSSEPKVASITLNQHEASVITDESLTISFKLKNYRGDVLVINSDVNICRARIEKKNLIIDGLIPGTAVLTVIAGDATDELTLNVEERTLTLSEHEFSLHARNEVFIPFTSNGDYSDLHIEVFDVSNPYANIQTNVYSELKKAYVICYEPCQFKIKVSSHDAYDIASFDYYRIPWPSEARSLDGKRLIVLNTDYEIGNQCIVFDVRFDECMLYTFAHGDNGTLTGECLQYGTKAGKYYFISPVFDFDEGPGPTNDRYLVVDFNNMYVWGDLSGNSNFVINGPNFEPYHLKVATFIEGISFTAPTTYRVGEEVKFESTSTNDGADYFPSYAFNYDDRSFFESLEPFNRKVIFNKPGTYTLQVSDLITNICLDVDITVID